LIARKEGRGCPQITQIAQIEDEERRFDHGDTESTEGRRRGESRSGEEMEPQMNTDEHG
jgi:hypothetical protein